MNSKIMNHAWTVLTGLASFSFAPQDQVEGCTVYVCSWSSPWQRFWLCQWVKASLFRQSYCWPLYKILRKSCCADVSDVPGFCLSFVATPKKNRTGKLDTWKKYETYTILETLFYIFVGLLCTNSSLNHYSRLVLWLAEMISPPPQVDAENCSNSSMNFSSAIG